MLFQIGNQWILTAAHCTTIIHNEIGATVKVHDVQAENQQRLTVEKIYNHESYRGGYNYMKEAPWNDFALLKLRDVS